MTPERNRWFTMLRDKKTRVFISGSGTLRTQTMVEPYPWGETRWGEETDLWTFDLKSRDREYWRRVRSFLAWLAPYVSETRWAWSTYKELRRRMFSGQAKNWDDADGRELCLACVETAGEEAGVDREAIEMLRWLTEISKQEKH